MQSVLLTARELEVLGQRLAEDRFIREDEDSLDCKCNTGMNVIIPSSTRLRSPQRVEMAHRISLRQSLSTIGTSPNALLSFPGTSQSPYRETYQSLIKLLSGVCTR